MIWLVIMSDLRKKIHAQIMARDQPVDMFEVSRTTVYNVKKLFMESGDFKQRPSPGRPRTAI